MRGRVGSVDPARFSMIPRNDVPRSAFDIRHGHKTTFNAGLLVPVLVEEVLPGDSLRLSMTAFCRMSTPIVPMMDNLEFESYFFFTPYRLLWDNWQRFMGEKLNPTDSTTFLAPYVNIVNGDLVPGASVADYMGITLNGSGNTMKVSALPFRAYSRIFNEWFRDQDIQAPLVMETDDGPDTYAGLYFLARVNKRHDYFTSARPWPAKPFNIDQVPATSSYGTMQLNAGFESFNKGIFSAEGIGAPLVGFGFLNTAADNGPANVMQPGGRTGNYTNTYNTAAVGGGLVARIGAGGHADMRVLVNDIRTAEMVQVMMEKMSRGGSRYTEIIRAIFGVTSPDARLQRPEYLGGGRTMIQVNPVAQTSASGATGTTTKLGELAAIGTGMVHGHGFSQSFTEHGVILGLVCVKHYLTYQQGIERMWFRRTQFDFYWPGLAHLPEQSILSQEIFADGSASDVTVFGYQERWAEYKHKNSRTSGYFRSTVATPLDMWHLADKFDPRPLLNGTFIEENPPISRVSQVATNFGEDFLFDSLFDCRWVRCMPMFSIPGLGQRL